MDVRAMEPPVREMRGESAEAPCHLPSWYLFYYFSFFGTCFKRYHKTSEAAVSATWTPLTGLRALLGDTLQGPQREHPSTPEMPRGILMKVVDVGPKCSVPSGLACRPAQNKQFSR